MFQSPPPGAPGTVPAMVASLSPPTPEQLVNRAVLAALVFTTNTKGIRTFFLKFRARAIGSQYKLTLDAAINNEDFSPSERSAAYKMHVDIYDLLILTFKDNDDILNEMTTHCGALGPKCMKYLKDRYDSSSLAVSLNNVGTVMEMAVHGPDDIDAIAAINKRFPDLAFSDSRSSPQSSCSSCHR
eukprot:2329158-Prymnesium_polylepis.1